MSEKNIFSECAVAISPIKEDLVKFMSTNSDVLAHKLDMSYITIEWMKATILFATKK